MNPLPKIKIWNQINILKAILVLIFVGQLFFVIGSQFWPAGDEPSYLLGTQSIIQDRDLNLTNNQLNKDFCQYHCEKDFVVHSQVDIGGNLRPTHGILTSIIVSPGYFIADVIGARISIFLIHLFGCFVLYQLLKAFFGFSEVISLLTLILYNLSSTILGYTRLIFPDLLAGYILLFTLSSALIYQNNRNKFWLVIAGLLLSTLVFLHTKFLILSLLCAIIISFKQKLNWAQLSLIIAPILISLISYSYISQKWFGVWLMTNGGKLSEGGSNFINPLIGAFGLLYDVEFGLLSNSIIFLLIFPGLFIWYRLNKTYFYYFAIPAIVYFAVSASYKEWFAGFAPGPRFLMTCMPLLVPALGYYIQSLYNKYEMIFTAIIVFLSTLSATLLTVSERVGFPFFENYNAQWRTLLERLHLNTLEYFSIHFWPNYTIKDLVFASLITVGIFFASYRHSQSKVHWQNKMV
jgi:hypothetical protein